MDAATVLVFTWCIHPAWVHHREVYGRVDFCPLSRQHHLLSLSGNNTTHVSLHFKCIAVIYVMVTSYLVLSIDHGPVKVIHLRLQIIHSEFLDQHAPWGHSDLTGMEERGSVCLDNSHFRSDKSAILPFLNTEHCLLCCVDQCECVCTTLGSRLFSRSGMRDWVRTYMPRNRQIEKKHSRGLAVVLHLKQKKQKKKQLGIYIYIYAPPIVLVAKFFSSPSVFTSLWCTMQPALFICHLT